MTRPHFIVTYQLWSAIACFFTKEDARNFISTRDKPMAYSIVPGRRK